MAKHKRVPIATHTKVVAVLYVVFYIGIMLASFN